MSHEMRKKKKKNELFEKYLLMLIQNININTEGVALSHSTKKTLKMFCKSQLKREFLTCQTIEQVETEQKHEKEQRDRKK